jgi:homoserine kinase type II
MGVFTGVSEDAVAGAVTAWGQGDPVDVTPTPHGIENTNLFVTTADTQGLRRQWVLTILDHDPAPAGLAVLAAAARAGLPVPAPLARPDGARVGAVEGRPALLAPRLPGAHPETPDARACAAAGDFLARLHAATAGLDAPDHPRDAAWIERGVSEHAGRVGGASRALLEEGRSVIADAAARRDWRRLPAGVVHGDLFRDNALFAGGRLTGVIDFHHAARAPLAFDLAVTANDWCTAADGTPEPRRLGALLAAYHARRPLTAMECGFWPVLGALAALRFWIARLDSPRKPPAEMARILAAHLRRPLRPDPAKLDALAGSRG